MISSSIFYMPLCMHDQLLHSYLTLTTPWTVAHQAPLYMGFSMQEYWSGLPCLPPGDLPKLGIKPRSPTLQANSLPSEPPENPKNTGVGSLTLLQGIFPAQESNWGLLHCRRPGFNPWVGKIPWINACANQTGFPGG